jgi:AcrR family transcriptional regulator
MGSTGSRSADWPRSSGVGTMTLYWYVQNKDEVLDLVADRMLAGIDIPAPETDWQVAVREVSISVRAAACATRGCAR